MTFEYLLLFINTLYCSFEAVYLVLIALQTPSVTYYYSLTFKIFEA